MMKEGGNMLALIVAKPGPLRDSLQVFLLTLPQIETVRLVDDAPSALRAVTEHDPALVLVDANLPGDGVLTALRRIKAEGSQSRCLVLADDIQQQQDATAAGADAVFVIGFPPASLLETIERLLPEQAVGSISC
jgi:DNA-binding NarL/FixJ family response regulator